MATQEEIDRVKAWLGPARDQPEGPEMISVNKASLLAVVRKLDFGAVSPGIDFASAFDDLRCAFTPDEVATGKLEVKS